MPHFDPVMNLPDNEVIEGASLTKASVGTFKAGSEELLETADEVLVESLWLLSLFFFLRVCTGALALFWLPLETNFLILEVKLFFAGVFSLDFSLLSLDEFEAVEDFFLLKAKNEDFLLGVLGLCLVLLLSLITSILSVISLDRS